MSDKFKRVSMMSLKSRIMLYTVLPVLLIILFAGGFMTFSVRRIIDDISRSEAWGSTALACNRVDDVINSYGDIAAKIADNDNIERFLYTADDRDTIVDNPYFGYVMGELDSAVSEYPELFDCTWLVSVNHQGVAFSNSSVGWTAPADFEGTGIAYYDDVVSAGSFYITDLYLSPVSGKNVISVIAPVRDPYDGDIIGVFGADIKLGGLWMSIAVLPESKSNEIIITTSDTTILYHPEISHIYSKYETLGLREVTYGVFRDSGRELVGSSLLPLRCGWNIYALRDYAYTKALIAEQTRLMIVTFAAVAAMLVVALSMGSRKIAEPLQEYTKKIRSIKISENESIENEEDILLVPEGCRELEQFAVGFNELITRNHEMMSQLREMNIRSEKERKLYKTALQSSSDVVFEYDIDTDMLITYGSVSDPSMPKTIANEHPGFIAQVLEGSFFKSFDSAQVRKFFSGDTSEEAAVSRPAKDGSIKWISFSGTPVFADEKPVKIVGKIRNIDDVMNLREDAERDNFTGLYNKTATEKMIGKKLDEGGNHAVILIDVDNFKSINDILGHAYGDYVIKDVAAKIQAVLRPDDIPGRIGGDEYMVFISGDDAAERIPQICEAFCNSIRFTYFSDDQQKSVSVSASIGAAAAPEYGKNFRDLYSSADIAMYISKNSGKDRFTVYSGQERTEYKSSRVD